MNSIERVQCESALRSGRFVRYKFRKFMSERSLHMVRCARLSAGGQTVAPVFFLTPPYGTVEKKLSRQLLTAQPDYFLSLRGYGRALPQPAALARSHAPLTLAGGQRSGRVHSCCARLQSALAPPATPVRSCGRALYNAQSFYVQTFITEVRVEGCPCEAIRQ